MIADVPAGGPDIPGLLASIDAKLGSIDAELARIEDEEIPAVERRVRAGRNIGIAALILGVVLALAVGIIAFQNARRDAANVRANCLAGNQARADDLKAEEVFTRYVRDTASDPASPAVRAEAERILALFRAKDRQRPCPK